MARTTGHSYLDRGLAYAGNGEFDKAVADYNEAIGYDPQDIQTPRLRAATPIGP